MIRTQPIGAPTRETPWLERPAADRKNVEKYQIDEFPFSIGRQAAAGLTLDSTRVSREHAVIDREPGGYRIRDLRSTNGTFVNGRRIEEAMLVDGDLVMVADLEFTFYSGRSAPLNQTVTQPIAPREAVSHGDDRRHVVRALRQVHEMLLHRALPVAYCPLVCLNGGGLVGYEALGPSRDEWTSGNAMADEICHTEGRLRARLLGCERMLAVEQCRPLGGNVAVLVHLDAVESAAASLPAMLRLRDTLASSQRLVVVLEDDTVDDRAEFVAFHAALRTESIGVVYDNVAGGAAHLARRRQVAPDYVRPAGSLVQAAKHGRRRQLEELVRAASDIGAATIAAGIHAAEEAELCRQVGCCYAQGDWAGRPRVAGELAASPPMPPVGRSALPAGQRSCAR